MKGSLALNKVVGLSNEKCLKIHGQSVTNLFIFWFLYNTFTVISLETRFMVLDNLIQHEASCISRPFTTAAGNSLDLPNKTNKAIIFGHFWNFDMIGCMIFLLMKIIFFFIFEIWGCTSFWFIYSCVWIVQ